MVLVDFSPLERKVTKATLFSWDELRSLCEEHSGGDFEEGHVNARPEFRFLGEEPGFQPSYYGVPREVVSLCESRSSLSLMEYISSVRTLLVIISSMPTMAIECWPTLGSSGVRRCPDILDVSPISFPGRKAVALNGRSP